MRRILVVAILALGLSVSAGAQGKLKATVTAHSVALTCTASVTPGVAGYNFYRGAVAAGPFTVIGSPTTCAFTDTNVTAGSTYVYQVTSFCPPLPAGCSTNIAGESLPSSQFTATIPNPQPPGAPTGLSGTVAVIHIGTQDRITATWSDVPMLSTFYVLFNATQNFIQMNGAPTPNANGTYSISYTGAPFNGNWAVCDAHYTCMILNFLG